MKNYPCITINLDAIKQNAKVVCDICSKHGIMVAGVVKFSDGDINVSKAYADGGCAQLAVSRAVHLKSLKEKGADLNVLTASPHSMLDVCLKRLGIYDIFTNVWSCMIPFRLSMFRT